jgi:uncharacterized protein YjaZ
MLKLDGNFENSSGFLLFLNRNTKHSLSEMQALLNHELDHYFDMVINGNDDLSK